jgi:hypothetical protein
MIGQNSKARAGKKTRPKELGEVSHEGEAAAQAGTTDGTLAPPAAAPSPSMPIGVQNVVPSTPEQIAEANAFLTIASTPNTVEDCRKYLTSAGQLCRQAGLSPKELLGIAGGITPGLVIDGVAYFDFMAVREIESRQRRAAAPPAQHQATDAEQRYYATEEINRENAAKAAQKSW